MRACQTASRWQLLLAAGLVLVQPACGAGPAPTPAAWERDLEAVRALQMAAVISPASGPADDVARRARLDALYEGLVARYPDHAPVQKAAGDYYIGVDQPERALACWQHAETLDPADADTAESMGSALLRTGNVRDACAQFERAVRTRPNVAAYHFDLANVLYLFRHALLSPPGRPDEQAALTEALGHFRRAAELAPGDARLAQAYAETFYIFPHPDWEQALAAWRAVLALSGTDTDLVNEHLARVSLKLRRPAEADMYLDRIHSPQFDELKAKFRQQAAAMATPGAAQ